jgi:hypothetical protein
VWATADVAFTAAALAACAWLTAPADYNTWANFMYPFSVVEVLTVGLGLTRLRGVIAAALALAAVYSASAVVVHGDPLWNVLPNAVSYLANAGISWLADQVRALPGPLTVGPQAATSSTVAAGCRAEIAPAVIMGGFIPMGIRVGLNWCIITRLMAGLVAVSWLTSVIAPFLPAPFGFIAGQIANYIVRNAGTLRIVGLGCGYWTYAYLLWAPPATWISCTRWPY